MNDAQCTYDTVPRFVYSYVFLPSRFTGKERDSESGLDYFGARYYGSTMGRWMSPDPGNIGADPTNPQSWNMYAYVLNNPLRFVDPNGLYCAWEDGTSDDDPGMEEQARGIATLRVNTGPMNRIHVTALMGASQRLIGINLKHKMLL